MTRGTSLLAKRFAELDEQADTVLATKHYQSGSFSGDFVDNDKLTNWRVKVRNLLEKSCGVNSPHYAAFEDAEKNAGWSTNYTTLLKQKAVFEAAREDFEGGYMNSVRHIVQAEVFSSELEQARELLNGGYTVASAVVAGVVLETTLRQMCEDNSLAIGKLDKMNADLAKNQIYTLLVQKRITALADIRNNAAHGHPDKFTKDDVRDMINYIEGFVSDQLS